jgi:hypothetical protein
MCAFVSWVALPLAPVKCLSRASLAPWLNSLRLARRVFGGSFGFFGFFGRFRRFSNHFCSRGAVSPCKDSSLHTRATRQKSAPHSQLSPVGGQWAVSAPKQFGDVRLRQLGGAATCTSEVPLQGLLGTLAELLTADLRDARDPPSCSQLHTLRCLCFAGKSLRTIASRGSNPQQEHTAHTLEPRTLKILHACSRCSSAPASTVLSTVRHPEVCASVSISW